MYSTTNDPAGEPEDTDNLYNAGMDLTRQFQTLLDKLQKRLPRPADEEQLPQEHQQDPKPTEAPTSGRCCHGQQQVGSNASNLGLASHFGPLANQHRSDALQPALRMDPSELKLIIKLDTWMTDNGSVIVRPSLVEDRGRGDDALCSCNAADCLKDLRDLKDLKDQKRRGRSDQAANNSSQRRLGVIQGQQNPQQPQQKQQSAALVRQHRQVDVSAKANVVSKRRSRTVAVADSSLQQQQKQQQQQRNPRQPNRQQDGRATTAAVVVAAGTDGDNNNDDDNNNAEDDLSSGASSESSSASSLASVSASSIDGGSSGARRRRRRDRVRRGGGVVGGGRGGGVGSSGVDVRQLAAERGTPPTQGRGCRGCNQ